MEFKYTEDMEDIRKLARDFAEKKLLPTVKERDENETFDRGIFDEMGKLGLMGIPYAEEYNGCGLDFINFAIACEEISRVDPSTGIGFEVHTSLCCWPINQFGTEEQKKKYLSKLTTGEWLGAFGLTEPNAGTDALNGATVAVKNGDEYILNGTKIFNTNGGEAEVEIIFAATDKTKGPKGMSAFIVEKGTPGLSFGKKEINCAFCFGFNFGPRFITIDKFLGFLYHDFIEFLINFSKLLNFRLDVLVQKSGFIFIKCFAGFGCLEPFF